MEHPLNIYITADALISSLGFGIQENLEAIRNYRSGITLQEGHRIANTPILAATIDPQRLQQQAERYGLKEYTRLEQLFILAIREVAESSGTDLENPGTGLILSTTKGNIDLLARQTETPDERVYLWKMAERIADFFHAEERVHVVSNACISGVSALITGKRLIETGVYKRVIVAGGDLLSHFITSGFLSFKSVSMEVCRPYDARRDGLNLGEACGAVALSKEATANSILLSGGAISNDANHISGPSRTGDGLYFAIRQAMEEAGVDPDAVSFINTHGTATVYNDEMESKAIHLAHLQNVPVHSLKPYFGHTLGASGVIESIVCMHELKDGLMFGTPGYESCGVPMPVIVNATHQRIPMQSCVKTASGFGGCNAAIVLTLPEYRKTGQALPFVKSRITATVTIEKSTINRNGQTVFLSGEADFAPFIREAWKNSGGNNMKFYKMDDLCKLGYVAADYLLEDKKFAPEETGILLSNAASSLQTDIRHQELIDQGGDEAASPAVFVYTLPNVVSGEICIRHKIQGENTFFISRSYPAARIEEYARTVMAKGNLKACITGWCELEGSHYKAEFKLIEKE